MTYWIWTVVQGMLAASYFATGEVFAAGMSGVYGVCFLVFDELRSGAGVGGVEDVIYGAYFFAIAVLIALPTWTRRHVNPKGGEL